jgi:predicted Zn-dependent protease
MAMAGYDPRAALDLWEFMSCVEADALAAGQSQTVEDRFALLRTHPTSEERQIALGKDLDGAMRLWRENAPKVKAKVKREIARAKEEDSAQQIPAIVEGDDKP